MRRKSKIFINTWPLNTGFAILFFTSSLLLIHSAPTSLSGPLASATSNVLHSTVLGQPDPPELSAIEPQNISEPNTNVKSFLSSKNIIRSIGFRSCNNPLLPETSGPQGQIKLSNLALLYDEQSNTISLSAEGTTENELDVTTAHILLTAYDNILYDHAIDLSKVAPLIPRLSGKFSFQETFSAPKILPAQLPKQLFSFPAVEALASIQLYDPNGTPVLCASVPLTNAVSAQSPVITIASVSLTAASVALAAITGLLAFLSSAAVLTTMPLAAAGAGGNVGGTTTGLSPSVVDVVSFCQFIAMSGSLTLEYPELLQQWTQNFGWSIGLVHSEGWNEAINNLRARTSRSEDVAIEKAMMETKLNTTSSDKMLYNSHVSTHDDETKAASNVPSNSNNIGTNTTATMLSMQSMMDGAVKNFVEKAVHNQTKGQPISLAMAKVDLSDLLNPTHVKRQASLVPPASTPTGMSTLKIVPTLSVLPGVPTSFTVPTPSPSSPTPIVNADLPPSPQDNILMNRFSDRFSALNAVDPANSVVGMSPSPPVVPPGSWPQGGYHPSTSALRPPGLDSYGQRLHIPAKNMFMTSLFLFLILLLATSIIALFFRIGLEIYAYFRPGKFTKLRRRFTSYYLGSMLRVVLLAYFAVATMAFYQLTLQDSWAITLLAVMTVLLFLALITYITLRLRRAGGTSLFFDERIKSKYGALYDQYILSVYWFFVPVLLYQITKAAIVGLGQYSIEHHQYHRHNHGSSESWAQISLLLLVELVFAALIIWKRPFSDLTPNRLNITLGCVRVLNIIMLAILIEGTTLSAITRTAVGMVITGTQALVMLVLAMLISYQLGKALWRLWRVIQANKAVKENKKQDVLSDSEVIVISVKKEKDNYRGDDEDGEVGERQGRNANEFSRWGDESMTGLVGMMGIGSNPTIQCTPASDDENDDNEAEISSQRQSLDVDFSKDHCQWDEKEIEGQERVIESEGTVKGIRESTQSFGSQSSHILDYYKSSYLPANFKNLSDQYDSGSSESGLGLGSISEDDCQEFKVDRLGLFVPDVDPNGPWIQSAYMTRRRSESAVRTGHISDRNIEPNSQVHDRKSETFFALALQQQRRRPASMGGERQVADAITLGQSASVSRSVGTRFGCEKTRRDSLPVFRNTLIPESLLAGPPSPSTMPQRTSVSSAMLLTPPPISPILGSVQDQEMSTLSPLRLQETPIDSPVSDTTPIAMSQPLEPSASVTNGIHSFAEYRFPDERQALSSEGSSGAIAVVQRNIHPLSPFHPDYRHPDDFYNAQFSSPNEPGPLFTSMTGRSNSLPSHGSVPNAFQDGTYSRRETRTVAAFVSASSSHIDSNISLPAIVAATYPVKGKSTQAAHMQRGDAPGLKIVTTLSNFTPAPQIPLPTVPVTPFTSSLPDDFLVHSAGGIGPEFKSNIDSNLPVTITKSASSSSSFSTASAPFSLSRTPGPIMKLQQQQQQTPTSITWNNGSQENMIHALTQESHLSNTIDKLRSRESSSDVTSTSLGSLVMDVGGGMGVGSKGIRQRALSMTPITLPDRPLTVSSMSRRGSQAAR
ncbi:hypothetical protein FBU30_005620 [Linnemannia zychae]|nr:hypothetical protein FBU30_005620 [Linnemannia zychae]